MYLKKFYIASYTTRNVFKKSFILRVIQPQCECERCRTCNCRLYNL